MMAFPLRYAAVADRTIRYRDQELLVPGVATILNELLGQASNASAGGTSSGQGDDEQVSREQSQTILNELINRNMPVSGRKKSAGQQAGGESVGGCA